MFRSMLLLACLAWPAAAQQVPVEVFAKASPFSMPTLSPSGEYLAMGTDFGEGNHAVQILRLSDMQRSAVLRLPRFESPYQIIWVSDKRLVVAKGRKYGSLEKPLPMGEIVASDFDGQNQRYIYGYEQQNAAAGLDRGFGFIEGMRADPNHKATPVLVLTTESDAAKKQRARDAGATGWIVKPFDPAKLVDAVRRVAA